MNVFLAAVFMMSVTPFAGAADSSPVRGGFDHFQLQGTYEASDCEGSDYVGARIIISPSKETLRIDYPAVPGNELLNAMITGINQGPLDTSVIPDRDVTRRGTIETYSTSNGVYQVDSGSFVSGVPGRIYFSKRWDIEQTSDGGIVYSVYEMTAMPDADGLSLQTQDRFVRCRYKKTS